MTIDKLFCKMRNPVFLAFGACKIKVMLNSVHETLSKVIQICTAFKAGLHLLLVSMPGSAANVQKLELA